MASFQARELAEVSGVRTREWIWENRIPHHRVTLLSGDAGVGKTHMYASVITSILKQEAFVDGIMPGVQPGNILVLTTESETEDLEEVLEAQGCDGQNIRYVKHIDYLTDGTNQLTFDIDRDMAALVEQVSIYKPLLIIFDPLVEFHNRKEIDTHSIRGLMVKLQSFCAKFKVAILAVIHWNKDEKKSRKNRVAGSHQYSATVRAQITITRDAKDPSLRHMYQDKMSLGPEPGDLSFRITPPDGMIIWLDAEEDKDQEVTKNSKLGEAENWLLKNLQDRPLTIAECVELSAMPIATLNRARHALGERIITARSVEVGKVVYRWEVVSEKNLWGAHKLLVEAPSL